MEKMMSLTFFAFTPAYSSYAAEKVTIAVPVEDETAVEIAASAMEKIMETRLVATR